MIGSKKIFVGYATWEKMVVHEPCMYFPESNDLVISGSFKGIVDKKANVLGPNWRERITYELPGKKQRITIGKETYILTEITTLPSMRIFEKSMEKALARKESALFQIMLEASRMPQICGLSTDQYMILETAAGEERIASEIAKLLPISPATISNHIAYLRENGYIEKTIPQKSFRGYAYGLLVTEKGQLLLGKVRDHFKEKFKI